MAIEIRHLRLLCAIAEVGSLSRAAAELGLSQPSVTASLHRLETQVSGRLFERSHRGVVPTALGAQLISRARIALAEVDQLEFAVGPRDRASGLRVGLAQMACTPTMIREMEAAFGHGTAFAVEASTAVLAHGLKQDRQDLSVILVSDDMRYELPVELHSRVIQPSIPVFVSMRSDHRLASADEVHLSDLAEDAWIGPPGADDGSLAELRSACADSGFVPEMRFTVPPGNGRRLIAETNAVQLVEPACPDSDGVVTRPLVGDPIRMRVMLVWQQHHVRQEIPDIAHRVTMNAYSEYARSNPSYVSWWKRRRTDDPWVRQLDAVFAD